MTELPPPSVTIANDRPMTTASAFAAGWYNCAKNARNTDYSTLISANGAYRSLQRDGRQRGSSAAAAPGIATSLVNFIYTFAAPSGRTSNRWSSTTTPPVATAVSKAYRWSYGWSSHLLEYPVKKPLCSRASTSTTKAMYSTTGGCTAILGVRSNVRTGRPLASSSSASSVSAVSLFCPGVDGRACQRAAVDSAPIAVRPPSIRSA